MHRKNEFDGNRGLRALCAGMPRLKDSKTPLTGVAPV